MSRTVTHALVAVTVALGFLALVDTDRASAQVTFAASRLNNSEPIISETQFANLGVSDEGANINGPSLIRVPDWIAPEARADPLAQYYLYFADHDGDYIRLAWAAQLPGPWTVHQSGQSVPVGDRGVLDLGSNDHIDLQNGLRINDHLASPDVLVDDVNQRIIMYFHGHVTHNGNAKQQHSFVSYSPSGLEFLDNIQSVMLGVSYFRVFSHQGALYSVANGGVFYQPLDPNNPWQPPPNFGFGQDLWPSHGNPFKAVNSGLDVRHLAILTDGDDLYAFYSRIGDTPERILVSKVDSSAGPDSAFWTVSPPSELLRAQSGWECGQLPPDASDSGRAPNHDVNQLRDPGISQDEDGQFYLIYSGCGEEALGFALLSLSEPPGPLGPCTGDCNGDGQVLIHEVITGVAIAIGLRPIESCEAADGNDDGQVLINEVIAAANAGLSGCLP